MQNAFTQPALQEHTLRLYGELISLSESWAGKLLLGIGEGCTVTGFAAAGSLAGAVSLLIEPNMAIAKAALRDGGIDFLVSTLDEALRTIKNEIRKGRPLAVALVSVEKAALAELQDRGVLPDLLFRTDTQGRAESALRGWADVQTLEAPIAGQWAASRTLTEYLSHQLMQPHTWSTQGRAATRALDAQLLAVTPESDTPRRRWLQGIARYQRSAEVDYRTAWVTLEERQRVDSGFSA